MRFSLIIKIIIIHTDILLFFSFSNRQKSIKNCIEITIYLKFNYNEYADRRKPK